ncbi:aldo/keto reductase [Leucobacter musarum]|uniref:aldo/keto reductase n=1 Tax=Leucobacter musarum TaxID=1930747 RepID=UPI0006A783B0|nr:aldo/keto reductase [Leucobacter musarum]
MAPHARFTAHNGFVLPPIGLGTYKLNGDAGADAVAGAIGAGYRLVDTAFNYENEGAVGRGVRLAAGDGADDGAGVIVTSKLPGRHHEAPWNQHSVEESRARLGVDAIGLHLIHWPNPVQGQYVDAWQGLVDSRERGVVDQIGVSNFLPEHLERIEAETGVRPVFNQLEVHPYFPQVDAVELHRELGIITEAWSPIGRAGAVLDEPVIQRIAAERGATPVQIVLAWHAARGVVSIPRSQSLDRQRENLAAVEIALDDAEVAAITALGRPDGRLFDADPRTHEEQ